MIKNILKKIIIFIITAEAKLVLFRYRPRFVAIVGTIGKTTTKDLIFQVLSRRFRVRKTKKSLNSEIGLPLTILGHETGWDNPFSWLKIIISGFMQIFYYPNYPKWLVLETGIDRPNDMDKIARLIKPEISVITAFGSVPAHVEFFDSPEDVMKEEAKLLDYTEKKGAVILNADDPDILKLKNKSKVKTYTYGINNEESDILATNSQIEYNEEKNPTGITFKINNEGNVIPIIINRVLGDQYIYPTLAAVAVGKILGISPAVSATAITKFAPAPGRMNLISAVNKSIIVDDTYNASPIAMHKALETLEKVECSGNKIVVLGDMLEIGRFSHSEHLKVGEIVAKNDINYLVTVGLRAEDIALSAIDNGMAQKRVFSFKDSEEAVNKVKELINEEKGSLLLAKGSQGIRVEKIVKEIVAEPEKTDKLLVRQEKDWLSR